ncbi:LAFE_0D02652g1_1 [Lachancea fermentati]|uniref:LAFE_0D02652g1_1 n=1 Tax=Lachancea fermentati TaxID=4955 RepID=A0A1G4MAU3_LACFM|nr:LAFE_0D02652g1_1 [Lachancea fermentati]
MSTHSLDGPSFLDQRSHSRLGDIISEDSSEHELFCPLTGFNPFDITSNIHVEPINWVSLQQVYPSLSAHGGPTYIYPAQSYFALGTSRGSILIFNYKQFLQTTLIVPEIDLRSEVTQICTSFDGTHIAASYKSGDVAIWDLNRNIVDSDNSDQSQKVASILHITEHCSEKIVGIGFVGHRHTAIVVGDFSGKVLYHSGFRNHLWQMSYNSKPVMHFSSSEAKLLDISVSPPLSDSKLSDLHLIGILSNRTFGLISTSGQLMTHYLEKVVTYQGEEGHISWNSKTSGVAYGIDCSLTILRLSSDRMGQTLTVVQRMTWRCPESIKRVEWVLNDLLGILTVSNEFLIVSPIDEFKIINNIDLLPFDPLPPVNKHFSCMNKQLFLLTNYSLRIGKFVSWSDIILHYVQRVDYMKALEAIGFFVSTQTALASLLGLQEDVTIRKQQLEKPFKNVSLASIRFLLNSDRPKENSDNELFKLFNLIIMVDIILLDGEYQSDSLAEEIIELLSQSQKKFFFDALSNQIFKGRVRSLPPVLLTEVLTYYAEVKDKDTIERLVLVLNPQFLNIDLAVRLSKKFEMHETLLYVWNTALDDYITPFIDLLYKITGQDANCLLFRDASLSSGEQIYDYLCFILTGRQYPKSQLIEPIGKANEIKLRINYILFSGTLINWPLESHHKLHTCMKSSEEPAFPYMNALLAYNPRNFLSVLNEILEDPFLDDENTTPDEFALNKPTFAMKVNRQYIIDILTDILRESCINLHQVLIAIFIMRNISKYPQYVKLSNKTLNDLITLVCDCDDASLLGEAQRSLESLFAVHKPSISKRFISLLQERGFDRALFVVYRQSNQYSKMLDLRVHSPQLKSYPLSLYEVLDVCIRATNHDSIERSLTVSVIRENLEMIAHEETKLVVNLIESLHEDLHAGVLEFKSETTQRLYLQELFKADHGLRVSNKEMKYLYVKLMCKSGFFEELHQWLCSLDLNTIEVEKLLCILKEHEDLEGVITVQKRLGNFSKAIDEVIIFTNETFVNCSPITKAGIQNYIDLAIEICAESDRKEQVECWVKLLVFLIVSYGGDNELMKEVCSTSLQVVFHKLALLPPSKNQKGEEQHLGGVLTAALEKQELILMKVKDMRPVLNDIFISYQLDENLRNKILKIINDSSLDLVSKYHGELDSGWSIQKSECEICGKVAWGMGLDSDAFTLWKKARENQQTKDVNEQEEAYALVVFKCHHGFHVKCMENLGQKKGVFSCLICE